MGEARPTGGGEAQEHQAALIRDSGNGPTADNEEAQLAAEFGEPDEHGVYGAPADDGGDVA